MPRLIANRAERGAQLAGASGWPRPARAFNGSEEQNGILYVRQLGVGKWEGGKVGREDWYRLGGPRERPVHDFCWVATFSEPLVHDFWRVAPRFSQGGFTISLFTPSHQSSTTGAAFRRTRSSGRITSASGIDFGLRLDRRAGRRNPASRGSASGLGDGAAGQTALSFRQSASINRHSPTGFADVRRAPSKHSGPPRPQQLQPRRPVSARCPRSNRSSDPASGRSAAGVARQHEMIRPQRPACSALAANRKMRSLAAQRVARNCNPPGAPAADR